MATVFTLNIAPDANTGVANMSFQTTLADPTDFLVFISAFQDMLGQPPDATALEIMGAWTESIMKGTMDNITGWVKAQRVAAVTVTAPNVEVVVMANT